jgi:phage baseplate assembly protein W
MPIIQSFKRVNPLDINKNVKIGVAFPLDKVNIFNGTESFKEQVKSNLINVLLTKAGERVNEPNFGVGLKNYLFENNIDTDNLNQIIHDQIQIYIPQITLKETIVNLLEDEHILNIKIVYSFNFDNETDAIQLNFNNN